MIFPKGLRMNCAGLALSALALASPTAAQVILPQTLTSAHDIGAMRIAKSNQGFVFDGQFTRQPREFIRWGGLWVGGVVDRDTLVSTAVDDSWNFFNSVAVFEFWPGATSEIVRRSINAGDPLYSPLAVSEQDMIVTYYDTLSDAGITGFDFIDNRPHVPLNLKVEERSYQWSYEYAEDFVLIDYEITNIGDQEIKDVYVGFWVDGDTFFGIGGGSAPIVGSQEFTSGTNTYSKHYKHRSNEQKSQ
ncbi:MAG: hypothetical protein ACE5GA_06585 [Candidatus Zixiibacteriota bacterium]